jgi:nucleotide-binding universal stress UspA family protein
MAGEFKSDVAVVHAIPSSLASMGDDYDGSEWSVRLASAARERIICLLETAGSQGEVYIEAGDAPAAVSEAARRLHADLLVIGRGSGSGLVGRLRANAYAILRESPCAVVSI